MGNFDDLLSNSPTKEQGQSQLSKEEYAAKKQAERESIYELSDQTAISVAGDGDKFKQYLDVQSNFDRYSVVNALLIMAQKPEATRLGNFDYWKNQGCFVKSGQIGIAILEPGKEYHREDGSTGTSYNIKKVFDVSQVDTRKLQSVPSSSFTERLLLQALISKAPVTINGVDELPGDLGAMSDPETGEISVRRGMEFSDTFRSVAQELCYAEIERSDNEPTDRHFSAYSAAYILCKKYGVDTQNFNFDDAPGILEGMNAQEVKGELSQIRDTADSIDRRMARHLDTKAKSDKSQEAR